MPPKRKKAPPKSGGPKAAKAAKSEVSDTVEALKAAARTGAPLKHKVDALCTLTGGKVAVFEDYDAMLNQTNVGHNNNKYYVIQVLQKDGKFYAWNRWGRVGEPGQSALKGPFNAADNAIADFKKKFKDKTRNDWDRRDSFMPIQGKYTLIEVEAESQEMETQEIQNAIRGRVEQVVQTEFEPSELDLTTQQLVSKIFDSDTFVHAMKDLELDVKKMPLGKLSKAQIARGFEPLERIEAILDGRERGDLAALSSQFFTVIPHNFGRQRPPVINSRPMLQAKMDMLMILADIELAQGLQKSSKASASDKGKKKLFPNPVDQNYKTLNTDLKLVNPKSNEYKIIDEYIKNTKERNVKLLNVWSVDRHDAERFRQHDNLDNRKLLWHGTNIAVVVAILRGGLRIMPHSGGRVGKGIYFASENGKSADYGLLASVPVLLSHNRVESITVVGTGRDNIGIMFLNEVALGKEHWIKQDDWKLRSPPSGFNSIVARGSREPDPQRTAELIFDGKKVVVPQGKPVDQPNFRDSRFDKSEYLVYREDQCRIRYLLELDFRCF